MRVPVPSSAKTNNFKDSAVPFQAIMMVMVVVLLGDKVISNHVHSWLSPVLTALYVLCTAYAILPSKINHGSIGYMRLIYAMQYTKEKHDKERLWNVK